jgi:hypothetical protein
MEEWRSIAGFPNYAVSSHGRIMRICGERRLGPNNIILGAGRPSQNGYIMVTLHGPSGYLARPIHYFVCRAFHGQPPSPLHQGAHGDANKLNNHKDNLRWATPKENMADCIAHGDMYSGDRHYTRRTPEKRVWGERNGRAKLTESDVRLILADTRLHKEIAADFGVCRSNISTIKRREKWKQLHIGDAA